MDVHYSMQMKVLKKINPLFLRRLNQDGGALEFADESLKKDKSIVLEAVKSNGLCISSMQMKVLEKINPLFLRRLNQMDMH